MVRLFNLLSFIESSGSDVLSKPPIICDKVCIDLQPLEELVSDAPFLCYKIV